MFKQEIRRLTGLRHSTSLGCKPICNYEFCKMIGQNVPFLLKDRSVDRTISILYVNHVSNIGGAETSLIDIIDNISSKYGIIVACPDSGDLVAKLRQRDAEHVRIQGGVIIRTFNPLSLIAFAYYFVINTVKLSHIIKSRKVRIIHANSFTACLFCSIPARIHSIPLVWHMRDLVKMRLFNKIFVSYAGSMANEVVATTTVMKNNLIFLGVKPEKISIINNGIDLTKYNTSTTSREIIRKEFGISLHAPLIGIVGQLTAWKGHRDFIGAASIVVERYPSAKFLIVGKTIIGDSDYRLELEDLVAKFGLKRHIIFTGFRTDMSNVMAALDILVNASWKEPFGRTIVESMAAGKPVIATNAGGVPEIIENEVDGILVPPRNPQRLADGVLKILNDPELGRKIGDAGGKTVRQKFSLERQMRKIEKLYENVLCC